MQDSIIVFGEFLLLNYFVFLLDVLVVLDVLHCFFKKEAVLAIAFHTMGRAFSADAVRGIFLHL